MTARSIARLAARAVAVLAVLAAVAPAFAVDPALRKQAKDADSFKRSDAARALAKEGSAEAAGIVADLFEDRSPYVRDAAVEACADLRSPEAVAELAKAAASKTELTRRNAAAALGKTKHETALATLGKLARKDASAAVRAESLDALWGFRKNAEALGIARDGAADADPLVRAAAVEAAGRIGDDGTGAAEIVRKALTDRDEGVRCVAWMELRYVARDEANARVGEAAADPSWRVRAEAVDDAAWLREAPSMEALVKLVGDPVARVSGAAHRVLRTLSGKDLGRDADLWKSWWEQNKGAWKAPRGRFEELKAPPSSSSTTATYHGLAITSERVAFVIDFSGSMRHPLPNSTSQQPRVDAARAELTKAVAAMPDGARANVFLFQIGVRRCFEKVPPLGDRARKDVDAFLRASPAEAGDLLAGVLAAIRDDEVDTVYLLSDGAPSAGEMVDKDRVQAAIRQANRTRKVAIHTIGFGASKATERAFMESVARESGGVCTFQ